MERDMLFREVKNMGRDYFSFADIFTPVASAKQALAQGAAMLQGPIAGTLLVSKKSVDLIIASEIGDEKRYNLKDKFPTLPGGASGITIGIGYDLGQGVDSVEEFVSDWTGIIDNTSIERLKVAVRANHTRAKQLLPSLKNIVIPLDAAKQVFYKKTLPKYAKTTIRAFPNVEYLYPDAQGAMLSLIYNRGASMKGDRRKEMLMLKQLIPTKNYVGMARSIRSMKRLWADDKNLRGLLIRRENEAKFVENANRAYSYDELIRLY